MVKRYVILANSSDKTFDIPRQLIEINGEPLICRTIRLLKENGVKDIIISSSNKAFDNLGAERYNPINNNYISGKQGYWLDAFPLEILNEPTCYLFGDVYYSENAINQIVNTETNNNLFFCSYQNYNKKYIKEWDEPLAYKVIDIEQFKEHINIVKKAKDDGKCCREPIVWELYRSMHGQDINKHIMTKDFIAINDESCDIDAKEDIEKLKEALK